VIWVAFAAGMGYNDKQDSKSLRKEVEMAGAVQVPEVVREAWGEQVVTEFIPWLDAVIAEKAVPRDEYREVLSRLDILEHDISDIKVDVRELRREMNERFDRMNERFDQMNQHFEARFDRMSERFDTRLTRMEHQTAIRFDQMNERFDQMYERMLVQTRWLIGSIAVIGTVISILLAIGQFVQ